MRIKHRGNVWIVIPGKKRFASLAEAEAYIASCNVPEPAVVEDILSVEPVWENSVDFGEPFEVDDS